MNRNPVKMQKEKNAIKDIVLVLFLISSNYIFSQKEKLNGKYSQLESLQEHYNYFVFDQNGEFRYHVGASLGDDCFGYGTYQFINHQLILNYNKTKPIKIGHHVSEIWTNNRDSINVHFKFFDFNNMPVPYVNVMYKVNLPKDTYTYKGVVADKEGIAKLNLSKENKEFQLIISNVGYNEYRFIVDKNYNYNISVFLQKQGNGLSILNQIDTLEIVKKKPKYFIVKNKNGSMTTWRKLED